MIESLIAAIALVATPQPASPKPDVVQETLVKLMVDPMPAPKPALKYLLLPELREQTQGNPIPNYLKRCILDQEFNTLEENISRARMLETS